uniref:Sushi domain-containing protein n=1 Tax=Periophthalmus magnuspinnatus TaxID=409849 RepID=A0A3B3ZXW9_9GOBI
VFHSTPKATIYLFLFYFVASPQILLCSSTQDLLNSLRQVQKMLAVQEASYQEGLKALRKKLNALHNRPTAFTLFSPDPPTHGRRLGRVFEVGHEVHFICKPGYELIGPRTRVCQESLKWSGQQPMCQRKSSFNSSSPSLLFLSSGASSSSLPMSAALSASSKSSSSSSSSSVASPSTLLSSSTSPAPSSVRPSHCTHFLGSTRCTCDVGFTISGRDNNICTDIDECLLFPLGQPGRLCVHQCVNTPGSFHCYCPRGYDLSADGRSCSDIDECETRMHNCTAEQVCVNTYGGFQCVKVECPNMKNATYIKTSSIWRGVSCWDGTSPKSRCLCRHMSFREREEGSNVWRAF